jgi:hypothetical protein
MIANWMTAMDTGNPTYGNAVEKDIANRGRQGNTCNDSAVVVDSFGRWGAGHNPAPWRGHRATHDAGRIASGHPELQRPARLVGQWRG